MTQTHFIFNFDLVHMRTPIVMLLGNVSVSVSAAWFHTFSDSSTAFIRFSSKCGQKSMFLVSVLSVCQIEEELCILYTPLYVCSRLEMMVTHIRVLIDPHSWA